MASAVKDQITCHMTAILKALDCAICLSIIKSPVSMGCGHFFCRFCIAEVLKSNYRTPCPLCKRSFTRRGIENADQRNSIVLAAGKLALECGKLTGANIVSPDTFNSLKDNDDTVSSSTNSPNEAKEEPKPSKSRKRKSQENICENVSSSKSCAATTESEVKVLNSDASRASGKILQESKRQCQSWSQSEDSEECELPSLDEILAFVNKSNKAKQLETVDKRDVQENKLSSGSNKKGLKVSFADTGVSCDSVDSSSCRVNAKELNDSNEDKGSGNNRESSMMQSKKLKTSKLRETILNKKNALKNKTNQIISDGNENIINKTPGNKKKAVDNSSKSPSEEKAKENINKRNPSVNSSLTNEASSLVITPKSSTKERSRMKPGKFSNNKALSEPEAMISKLKAAEDFTLTVVNTRSTLNPTIMNVSNECFNLNETNLHSLRENADDYQMECQQPDKKDEQNHITDTAVSVQSVASPTANKLETLSKSPGWSKVRQVGKDFRVKKFSKLPVEKNSSNSCPMESDISEDPSGGSPHERPKLIKISELEREALDKNSGCDPVNSKLGFEQNNQDKSKISLEQGSMTVTAEVHSQELNNSNSQENQPIGINEGNKNLSNCDETETSIVMSSIDKDKTQGSPLDKSIFCNPNISNTTKNVSGESIVNFNGSCIPSPEMRFLKSTVTKVLDPATDISGSAEIEFPNENEFSLNVQDTLTDTFDSHMVENDMDIDENHEHILPVLDNGVRPYTKKKIEKVSGLDIYNNQRNKESKSCKLPPKFTSVSKSVTTGTKSLFAGDETVYFASHSQQTSQRLLEVWDDNSVRNNRSLVPGYAFGLPRYLVPKFGFESVQNQVAPFDKLDSSEKTKVLKRTCLTLEEIQDAFANCRNEQPITICSLPFSSGEYRLDINVADETLNISVLKVGSFEKPKETVEKTSTLMFAEKNIQTSDSFPSPTTILPSSYTGSETSQPDNYDAAKPTKNLFPYLNQYFSDTDPSEQCNVLVEDNEEPIEVSEVFPYCKPDNPINPEQEPEEPSDVVKTMQTLLSGLQALPSKDFSLSDIRIVRDSLSVYDKVENDVQDKGSVDALPSKDPSPSNVQRMISNITDNEMGRSTVRETLRQSDELVISLTKKPDESLQYDDLPPTQVAINKTDILEANKTKHMTSSKDHSSQKESSESLKKPNDEGDNHSSVNKSSELKNSKGNECTNQIRPGKKKSPSPGQRQKTFPSRVSSINKSQHLSLMEKYSAEESDPDLAMVAELVGPLKELAEEMKASGLAPEETGMKWGERAGNQKRPLEVFEEMVLSKNNESPGMCRQSQRASRLSLKSKGNPKKFKRIQRYSGSDDSDSDKADIAEKKDASSEHKGEISPSDLKENATTVSPNEHGITHSFASEDLTNGNTSDIAMEIESLDEKIKSVLTKLKDIGREDLLESENAPDVVTKVSEELSSSLCDDDDAASDDSQKSTDIFSVPPTPPDAMS